MNEEDCLSCIMCGEIKGHENVKVCGNIESPFFLKRVSENDTCECFDGGEEDG